METAKESSKGFHINGMIRELDDSTKITLKAREDGRWVTLDSTMTNGPFEFEGSVDVPELYFIQIGASRSYISFFIENSEINIAATNRKLDEADVDGSAIHDIFSSYEDERDQIMESVRSLYYEMEDEKAKGNIFCVR